MNKNVYDYMSEMEKGFQSIIETSNIMKAKTENYQKEMEMYQSQIKKAKQRIEVINDRQVIVELSDLFIATAQEWGVDPRELVVNYTSKWDKVIRFSDLNKYEATKSANAFNVEKGVSGSLMPFNFDIEHQRDGVVLKSKTIPVNMPLRFVQKDGRSFCLHITAKVFSSDINIVQKLMIDDINQVLLTYQMKDLVKLDGNQIVPCNDLAMNILDCSVLYDKRQAAKNPNLDF